MYINSIMRNILKFIFKRQLEETQNLDLVNMIVNHIDYPLSCKVCLKLIVKNYIVNDRTKGV